MYIKKKGEYPRQNQNNPGDDSGIMFETVPVFVESLKTFVDDIDPKNHPDQSHRQVKKRKPEHCRPTDISGQNI